MSPVESLQRAADEARQWRGLDRRIAALWSALHRAENLPAKTVDKVGEGIYAAGRELSDAHMQAVSVAICAAARLLEARQEGRGGFPLVSTAMIANEIRSCV